MNLLDKPELLQRLGAAHALGTLRGGARRRFEALARQEPRIRTVSLVWQGRLSGLVELEPGVQPPPELWQRIDARIQRDLQEAAEVRNAVRPPALPQRPVASRRRWWQDLSWWQPVGLGAGLTAAVLVVVGVGLQGAQDRELAGLRQQLQAQAQRADAAQAQLAQVQRVEYVAVLADDSAAASMLVTFDPVTQRLTLKRVGGFREASDKSLQLWSIAPGKAPRSLGVLGDGASVQMTAQEPDANASPTLAVSLEPKGGVAGDKGPTGPVLFKGALLKTGI